MEAFIKNKAALLYVGDRNKKLASAEYRAVLSAVLAVLLWVGGAIALYFSFSDRLNIKTPSVQPAIAQPSLSHQATYQQFADWYKDPSLSHFLKR